MERQSSKFQRFNRPGVYILLLCGLLFNWTVVPLGSSFLIEQAQAEEALSGLSSKFYCSTSSETHESSDSDHQDCKECQCCHQVGSLFALPHIVLNFQGNARTAPYRFATFKVAFRFLHAPLSRGPPAFV